MFMTLDWTAPWLGHRHCPVGSSQGLLPAAGNKPPELECPLSPLFFLFCFGFGMVGLRSMASSIALVSWIQNNNNNNIYREKTSVCGGNWRAG